MNIAIFFLSITMLTGAPKIEFVKPTNSGEKNIKIMKPINFVDSERVNRFIHVGEVPVTYEELRYYAMYNCKNNSNPSEKVIDQLIQIEKSFSPPPEMRGMILAAACTESGYNPAAKGDRKFSKNKKKPMAIGILQLWPIYEKMYNTNRYDVVSSANSWMKHIVKMIPKVKRQCNYKKAKKVWLAAWVTGIRYKKVGGRCNERPKHYRLMKKWHKMIKNDRLKESYCRDADTCGC